MFSKLVVLALLAVIGSVVSMPTLPSLSRQFPFFGGGFPGSPPFTPPGPPFSPPGPPGPPGPPDSPSPSDFLLDFAAGDSDVTDEFTATTLSEEEFPILGELDFFIAKLELVAGGSFFLHFHPDADETVFVVKGSILATLLLDDTPAGEITNVLAPGQLTVFPEGLVHTVECVSSGPCETVSVLNDAEPGIVPV